VFLDDIALVNFALALGAQESGVRQDDPAKSRGSLARYHGRGHASYQPSQRASCVTESIIVGQFHSGR
jgi:hypothetical protein